ncbi:MAG: prepilin-type N-terminal cleavage/methylation domain-containing protein [Bacilli bacterium]|nr:prepilin-type N-terminal cleavage/methylation domain-containing protein [Bacilli bacterium]
MKNKGFVLMETIVVIVVISVALVTVFASYNKILSKLKTENKYDTSEYIYMTYYIKKSLSNSIVAQDITNSNITNYYNNSMDKFNVKNVYILTNLNAANSTYLSKFDAYMIDYIRKLDVTDNEELIIVEYKRPALKTDGNELKEYKDGSEGGILYETYIASLEW